MLAQMPRTVERMHVHVKAREAARIVDARHREQLASQLGSAQGGRFQEGQRRAFLLAAAPPQHGCGSHSDALELDGEPCWWWSWEQHFPSSQFSQPRLSLDSGQRKQLCQLCQQLQQLLLQLELLSDC
jgi:hypothetical protein